MIPEDDPRVSQIGHPAPPWLINYADLMTEMVCFFVILYALAAALNKDMQGAQEKIKEMIEGGAMQGQVAMDKEGLRITLEERQEQVFFQSGRAELTDDMTTALLKHIVPVLAKLAGKYDILVEGHTDNIPIATRQFASNWELSTARATNVVKFMLARPGFNPAKMAAVGYGEFHPIAVNNTEENRKKNRRVVFFVKTNSYPDKNKSAAPAGKKTAGAAPAAGTQVQPALSSAEGPAARPEAPPAAQEAAPGEGR